jgi:hypothetical protein
MRFPDVAALWAAYKIPIVVGVIAATVLALLLGKAVRITRLVLAVVLGAGLGVGAAWGLVRLGVPAQRAGWGAVVITLAVLILAALSGRKAE